MAAAPRLTSTQVQHSLRQKGNKKVATKNVLCSPFEVTWPRVKPEIKKKVLELLTEFFTKHKLERPKLRHCKNKKDRKKERDAHHAAMTDEAKLLMKNVVIGINGVTKCLEKNQLNLVLVDKSANPALLTNHLISLSAVSSCAAAALFDLSEFLSPLLQVTCATAVGFRKTEQGELKDLDELVFNISDKLPQLSVPWLQQSNQGVTENTSRGNSASDSESKDTENIPEKEIDKTNTQFEVVDVSKFYVMKKDTERLKKVQSPKKTESAKATVKNRPKDTEGSSDFISFENETGETDMGEESENSSVNSSKRKYEFQSDENIEGDKKKKTQFESTKVKKLKGNPNKVKKKKKKSK